VIRGAARARCKLPQASTLPLPSPAPVLCADAAGVHVGALGRPARTARGTAAQLLTAIASGHAGTELAPLLSPATPPQPGRARRASAGPELPGRGRWRPLASQLLSGDRMLPVHRRPLQSRSRRLAAPAAAARAGLAAVMCAWAARAAIVGARQPLFSRSKERANRAEAVRRPLSAARAGERTPRIRGSLLEAVTGVRAEALARARVLFPSPGAQPSPRLVQKADSQASSMRSACFVDHSIIPDPRWLRLRVAVWPLLSASTSATRQVSRSLAASINKSFGAPTPGYALLRRIEATAAPRDGSDGRGLLQDLSMCGVLLIGSAGPRDQAVRALQLAVPAAAASSSPAPHQRLPLLPGGARCCTGRVWRAAGGARARPARQRPGVGCQPTGCLAARSRWQP
jgi:hypothetical protein